jgi:hypothetical protein
MPTKVSRFLRQSVVIFLAGAILSAAVDLALGSLAERHVGILLILFSIFVLYTFLTFGDVGSQVNKQLDLLGLTSLWIYDPDEPTESYIQVSEIVRSAKRRVLVIGPYIPVHPPTKIPEGRTGYLKILEKVIKSQLDNQADSPFIYKRVIQSDRAAEAQGILRKELFGRDVQTYEHCKRVCEMLKAKPSALVNVEFAVSDPLPTLPSLLIIDDKYIIFALSTRRYRMDTREGELVFGGSLIIEDHSGKHAQSFRNIFDRIYQGSSPISVVDN